ncbi:MAG: undecaprenyl-diphosphatase UppP [Peptococcaceae bacterium]|nr:undecaprenyl-diphosphatase UppP [Peptococcaceae bacterium]
MSIWQAIMMGLIQGLGEFLPISSSGHLVLAPWIFDWEVPGLTFDIALHMGTLLAVLLYFWKDWVNLLKAAFSRRDNENRNIFWYLVFGSIPAAIVGFLFDDFIENALRSPLIVGVMLILFGILLYLSDKTRQIRKLDNMNLRDALLIGAAQAIALIPGVSRSGVTITAARYFSYTREEAARFSFLLSTPVIFGAGVLKMVDLSPAEINLPFIVGVLVSAIVGLLSISFLLRFVKRCSFKVFVGYRIILGLLIIFLYLFYFNM